MLDSDFDYSGTIMVVNDYYRVLEVSENASAEEIKAAYHKLAFKYHPDRNSSAYAEEQMKNINQAHDILSDPKTRVEYDRERKFGPGFSGRSSYSEPREYTWRKEYTWTWERQSGTGRTSGRTSGRKEWGGYSGGSGGPGSRTSASSRGKTPGWQSGRRNSNSGILDVIIRILGILAAIWIILLRPMLIIFLLILIALILAFWVLIIEILRAIRGSK